MYADYKSHDIKPFMPIFRFNIFQEYIFTVLFNSVFYDRIVGIHIKCIAHGNQGGNISVTTFTRRITNAEKVILRNNSWY